MSDRQLRIRISRADLERYVRERHLPREWSHMVLSDVAAVFDVNGALHHVSVFLSDELQIDLGTTSNE